MSMSANLHRVSEMRADKGERCAWLKIADASGNAVTVFMDYDMACEIADLWEAMNREPDEPTFDEALAAKCDADARTDEARMLKGMV